MPTMEAGDILGHEPMGEVVEVGSAISNLQRGDRVVVPLRSPAAVATSARKSLFSCCDNSNPNAEIARKAMGHSPARASLGSPICWADFLAVRPNTCECHLPTSARSRSSPTCLTRKCLFLSDIFPTGYMAAENCGIETGDTVAVWGCGPVAQFAIQSAWMLGAGRSSPLIAFRSGSQMACKYGKAETINFDEKDVYDTLQEMTKGRGPDRCIDAVGCEAHGTGAD